MQLPLTPTTPEKFRSGMTIGPSPERNKLTEIHGQAIGFAALGHLLGFEELDEDPDKLIADIGAIAGITIVEPGDFEHDIDYICAMRLV